MLVRMRAPWPSPTEPRGEIRASVFSQAPSVVLMHKLKSEISAIRNRVPFSIQGVMCLLIHGLLLAHPGTPVS